MDEELPQMQDAGYSGSASVTFNGATIQFPLTEEALVRKVRYEVVALARHLEKQCGIDKPTARLAAFEVVVFSGKDEFTRFRGE
jgi:hypothetical protein